MNDGRRRAGRLLRFPRKKGNAITSLHLGTVCVTMTRPSSPGAQTERRGDAGPVRGLLGGKDLTGRFSF